MEPFNDLTKNYFSINSTGVSLKQAYYQAHVTTWVGLLQRANIRFGG